MRLGEVRITVEIDGASQEMVVDLDPQRMTLKESVRLERAIGREAAEALFSGGEVVVLPSTLQALLWAKLASKFPGLELEGFDVEIGAMDLGDAMDETGELDANVIERALFETGEQLEDVPEGKASAGG